MLTGHSTFSGDTVADTIAKILEREPDWAALPREHRRRSDAPTPLPHKGSEAACATSATSGSRSTRWMTWLGRCMRRHQTAGGCWDGVTRWLPWVALVALAVAVAIREGSRPVALVDPLANARFTPLTYGSGLGRQRRNLT